MYLPFLVFPYQRDPCLWYTPVSVFTQTIPALFAGAVCDFAAAAEVVVPEADALDGELPEDGAHDPLEGGEEDVAASFAEASLFC